VIVVLVYILLILGKKSQKMEMKTTHLKKKPLPLTPQTHLQLGHEDLFFAVLRFELRNLHL
jgi:hypothetical protein